MRHCRDDKSLPGRGPTAGVKASMYEGAAPNGAMVRKRSFKLVAETAFMEIRETADAAWSAWLLAETRAQLISWGADPDRIVEARRVL